MAMNSALDPAKVRNVGILGGIGIARSTTTAQILSATAEPGVTPSQQGRGLPLTAAAVTGRWTADGTDCTVNLVDGPADVDFTVGAGPSLRVFDGAVVVLDAVTGARLPMVPLGQRIEQRGLPRISFVGSLDHADADFQRCVDTIVEHLGSTPLVMQLPIGAGADFKGVIDIMAMKALLRDPKAKPGDAYQVTDIPQAQQEEAGEWREKLVEALAESDQELMDLHMEGMAPTTEQLHSAVRRVTCAGKATPVFCGTAFWGVRPLLDAVVRYLPSPLDVAAVEGHAVGDEGKAVRRAPSGSEPLAAQAFRTASDPQLGDLVFVRVFSGSLKTGSQVLNPARGSTGSVSAVYRMRMDGGTQIGSADAGEVVAVAGLKDTAAGDTLCAPADPLVLASADFPAPVIQVAVEPKTKGDREKLDGAIPKLAAEDQFFQVGTETATGPVVIAGAGELHLDVLTDRMKREFKVDATVGEPQVAYRETIRSAVAKAEAKEQAGPSGQAVTVQIAVEPNHTGAGYEFTSKAAADRVPPQDAALVDAGCQEVMARGVLAGYPMVDVKVTLLDGTRAEADSLGLTLKAAGAAAFEAAARQAKPVLLEPVMAVEVTTPDDFLTAVTDDLKARRGRIDATAGTGSTRVVKALVPLAELFGYVGDVRAKTNGRASYSMGFAPFAEVPQALADKIVAKAGGK